NATIARLALSLRIVKRFVCVRNTLVFQEPKTTKTSTNAITGPHVPMSPGRYARRLEVAGVPVLAMRPQRLIEQVCEQTGLRDFRAGHGTDQPAFAQQQHASAEQLDLVELGRYEEDGDSLGRDRSDQAVDLVFGADVDSVGRLVEEEHAHLLREPASEDRLLLVPAGELAHRRPQRTGADVETFDRGAGVTALSAKLQEASAGEPVEKGQGHVLPDGHARNEPVSLP